MLQIFAVFILFLQKIMYHTLQKRAPRRNQGLCAALLYNSSDVCNDMYCTVMNGSGDPEQSQIQFLYDSMFFRQRQ